MNNEGEPILPKLHFMKNTLNAYGLITLPLREGKIFCKKILGGGLETKSKNRQFSSFFMDKRFIFFFKKDSRQGPASPSLLIPLFAKNSRLGDFFNANNPHLQQVGSATLPQGESDYPVSLTSIFVKCRGVSPQGERYSPKAL